jgi:Tol biopolymer transport system component
MISGKRAFKGDSSVETMNAILKEDPFEQAGITVHVTTGLERIIRRCLEKTPERRFQSASDLGFALEALSAPTSSSIAVSARMRRRWVPALVAVAVLALLAISYDYGRRAGKESPPFFHPLTFRRGTIRKARFAPDGETIVFGAAWDGNPSEVFTTRPDGVEARSLGLKGADILAVSSKGEMAVSLGNRLNTLLVSAGTLARVPLAGGEPREVLESVQRADWNPDGSDFAIVRNVQGRSRLEYPTDRVLYETGGWISDPRFSRDGRSIAFVGHSTPEDQSGSVTLVDLAGNKRILSGGWTGTVRGLAWSPDGKEVWFTAAKVGGLGDLYAVTPSGHQRLVARVPGGMALQDIDRTGRVLFTHDNWRREVIARAPGEVRERDFSWLDWSYPSDFSDTRKMVLISEEGSAGGPNSAVYLRGLNEPAAIRLGDGVALSISPDGKWVLSSRADLGQLALLPVKAGDVKWLPPDGLTHVSAAWVFGWEPLPLLWKRTRPRRTHLCPRRQRSQPLCNNARGRTGGVFAFSRQQNCRGGRPFCNLRAGILGRVHCSFPTSVGQIIPNDEFAHTYPLVDRPTLEEWRSGRWCCRNCCYMQVVSGNR